MDEIGRLQAMAGALTAQVARRPSAEIDVDVREQPIARRQIALGPRVQQCRDGSRARLCHVRSSMARKVDVPTCQVNRMALPKAFFRVRSMRFVHQEVITDDKTTTLSISGRVLDDSCVRGVHSRY